MASPISLTTRNRPPAEAPGPAFLSSGFRPFFFCAACAAVLLVPMWLVVLHSGATLPYWNGTTWHSHEMIFGYTSAVIVGFLLTAGANWSGRSVVEGRGLVALAALWLLGRVLPLLSVAPPLAVVIVDVAFLPVVAVLLARALVQSKSRRNYFFIPLVGLLTLSNLGFHAERFGYDVPYGASRDLALRIIALMILVIGGRVFPMFTRNATRASHVRNEPWLDKTAMGLFVAACIGEMIGLGITFEGLLWIFAGASNIARMVTWGTTRARTPLLWILHAGFFATAFSFLLQGAFLFGLVPYASALHCFSVGGIGLLTLGMMARVSLGHSGRMLAVPARMTWSFSLLAAATLVRVAVPIVAPGWIALSWLVSGGLWLLAFALLLQFGLPLWFQPRVDA